MEENFSNPENQREPQHEIQNYYNLFNLKSANQWMKEGGEKPEPEALFGDFWLEGELAVLFSDTGRGKSILAVQIAESLARGIPVAPMEKVPPAQSVLYFDFEMTEKQFTFRYSTKSDASVTQYQFSENFLRAQSALHDGLPSGYKNLSEFVYLSFREILRQSRARVVIVDNITFLKGANQNVSAAAQLMKGLKYVKDYHEVSILVLAHTPKRAFTSPLNINDLQGSNMLSNFADSVFALGASNQDRNARYLKQIKPRGSEAKYDQSNVVLFHIVKKDDFLQFEFDGYGAEREHLPWQFENDRERREELKTEARRMRDEGKSMRQISRSLAIPLTTVSRYLDA
jgi:hypothetical protein